MILRPLDDAARQPNHDKTPAKQFRRYRSLPKDAERKENHILTVREAARLFEVAGVARTQRSIVNWCQVNAQGIARLDAYFDPNERKYFTTTHSVELAITEEKAKAAKSNSPASEPVGTIPKASATSEATTRNSEPIDAEIKSMEHEIRDLQITNKAKDMFIYQLQKSGNLLQLSARATSKN